jgi:hypothetical protein
MPRDRQAFMQNPAALFRLLNEFIVLLLGTLVVLLAISRGVALPARPAALIAPGALMIYWSVRAWIRPEPNATRWLKIIRSSSLALVGLLVLGILAFPPRDAEILLMIAGGVLVLRGILASVLFARMS